MNAQREKAEALIYEVMDKLDKQEYNSAYYKALFAKMSDTEFTKFCKRNLPFRFHTKPFVVEPKMYDIEEALKVLKVPLLEKVALPYLYIDKNGNPVWSKKAMVIYIHIKKMKQFITKKNSTPSSIDNRDMKSGLLVSFDKGGKTSDREMEALAVMGLDKTMEEMATWRADYMDAKSVAYQTISTLGKVSEKEIPIDDIDSIAKNTLNSYLVSSLLNTNILNKDYLLPKTLADRKAKVVREV
jgi:hypothetical protein